MRQKLKFLRMVWRVMLNKEQGWIFFQLDDQKQKDYLSKKEITISIKYLGVDKRIIDELQHKLERSNTDFSLN